MAKISFSKEGSTPFQQLLGHNKTILEAWTNLEETLFSSPTFQGDLKEEIRRILAFKNKCPYCMAKGTPTNSLKAPREVLALEIADLIAEGSQISDDLLIQLKSVFSEWEISELVAFICFITASQKYGAFLDLQTLCEI